MKRFKNMLFVADGSRSEQSALGRIFELAAQNKAKVSVVSVLEDNSNQYYHWDMSGSIAKVRKNQLKNQQLYIRALIEKARSPDYKGRPRVVVLEGSPDIEIIRMVKQGGYDLVAKANQNDSALGDLFFGTLDMDLLRKCPCPVYIIKPGRKIRHARVMAAVDLICRGEERSPLDQTIMELASSMAQLDQGSLSVVHAWHLPHMNKLKNEERIRLYKTIEEMEREMRRTEKNNLDALVGKFKEFAPKSYLMKGKPEKVIPEFTSKHKIDLVVMGTVARTGIAGFFIGNTAEKILHQLSCSVLAIKPEKYVTPVV